MTCKFFIKSTIETVPDPYRLSAAKITLRCRNRQQCSIYPRARSLVTPTRRMVHPMYTVTPLHAKLVALIVLCVVTAFMVSPLAAQISLAADTAPAGCHHQAPAPAAPDPVSHHCCAFGHHPAALTGFTPDFSGPHDFSHLLPVDPTIVTSSRLPPSGILTGFSPPGIAPLRI